MDYYELLGVEKDANPEEIKREYRNKSKKLHPDAGGDPEEFARLNEAYTVLSDEDKRAFYDKTGKNPKGSIDIYEEAKSFLLQLFEGMAEDTGIHNGTDMLDEMYKQCRSRVEFRKKDIRFVNRTKDEYERKLGCILKEGEEETMFDSLLKTKITRCEEELALAEVDIQTIECALDLLKGYHPKPEDRQNTNSSINEYARKLLEEGEEVKVESLLYGKERDEV